MEILIRALVGGVIVSAFALLGDVFLPKRFAGLFGAAPAVALASLGLAMASNGKMYAAVEARSMIGGAIAFFVYAYCVCVVMMKYKPSALLCSLGSIPIWCATAFALWMLWLR
jgi:uncharacterized membrane protein (GlpM family)